jgi:putative tryptophan/tyrosine transport system permease protein
MIEGILLEGLIYGIMVLGVFITFRILDFPDLTVDGSFPLGAAIMASLILAGQPLWFALVMAAIGGILAGVVTALIHNKLGVPHLLAGILTMTMLYSVNIRVMGGRANISLIRQDTILTRFNSLFPSGFTQDGSNLIFFAIVAIVAMLLLNIFFRTDLGMTMGAMGNNPQMVISTGANPATLKMIGVALSNGMVAISGAFAAQYQGFADVNLGQGTIISGLASVMIGEFLWKSNRISVLTLRVILGSILFRAVMYIGRFYGYYINLTPNDLKLITGLLIILSLIITRGRDTMKWLTWTRRTESRAKSENLAAGAGKTQ